MSRSKKSPFDKHYHKRLRDFEAFDRIELVVVPRYKTSGLSGDEWRQGVAIRFYFKGEIVAESSAYRMEHAIMMLGSKWLSAQEPIPDQVIEIETNKCDQPSCCNDWTVEYEISNEFSGEGHLLDPSDQSLKHVRRFCKRHSRRGDASREDCDKNYKILRERP